MSLTGHWERKGHNKIELDRLEPTCEDDGWVDWQCSECRLYWNESTGDFDLTGDYNTEKGQLGRHILSASGHDWEEATCVVPKTCTVCNYVEQEALGHNYNWTTTKKATCTAKGSKTGTCTRCSSTKTEETNALGHFYGSWTEHPSTNCATGYKERTCSRCGGTDSASMPAATSVHSGGTYAVSNGWKSHDVYCSTCKTRLQSGVSHTWSSSRYKDYLDRWYRPCTASGCDAVQFDD